MTYIDLIRYLRPSAQVALVGGEEYSHIVWGDELPISQEELDAVRVEAQAAKDAAAIEAAKPKVVSMRQARLALLQAGMYQTILDAVPSMGDAAMIEWEYAADVRRDSDLVVAITQQLSMTEQQLDDLFTLAATL